MRTFYKLLFIICLNLFIVDCARNGTESERNEKISSVEFRSDKSEIEFGLGINDREDPEEAFYDEYEQGNEVSEKEIKSEIVERKGLPNEIFLTTKNLSDYGEGFRNFSKRNDVEDLQASASDNLQLNDSANATDDSPRWSPRAYRDARYPVGLQELPLESIALPYQHTKIDTADLSDCARQGEWRPIGEIHIDSSQQNLQQEHDYLIPGNGGDQNNHGLFGESFTGGDHDAHSSFQTYYHHNRPVQNSFAEFQKLTADAASSHSGGYGYNHLYGSGFGSGSSSGSSSHGSGAGGYSILNDASFNDFYKHTVGNVLSYAQGLPDFGKGSSNHNYHGHGSHSGQGDYQSGGGNGGGTKFYHGQSNFIFASGSTGSGGFNRQKQHSQGLYGSGSFGSSAFFKHKPGGGYMRYAPGSPQFNRKPTPNGIGDGYLSFPPKAHLPKGRKPGNPWKKQKFNTRRPNFDALGSSYKPTNFYLGANGLHSGGGLYGGGYDSSVSGGFVSAGPVGGLVKGQKSTADGSISGVSLLSGGGYGGSSSYGSSVNGHGNTISAGALLADGGYSTSSSYDNSASGHKGTIDGGTISSGSLLSGGGYGAPSGSYGSSVNGHGGTISAGALLTDGGFGTSSSYDNSASGHKGTIDGGTISSGSLLSGGGYGAPSGSYEGLVGGHKGTVDGGTISAGALLTDGGFGTSSSYDNSASGHKGTIDGGTISSGSLLSGGGYGAPSGSYGSSVNGHGGTISAGALLTDGGFGTSSSYDNLISGHKGTIDGGTISSGSLLTDGGYATPGSFGAFITGQKGSIDGGAISGSSLLSTGGYEGSDYGSLLTGHKGVFDGGSFLSGGQLAGHQENIALASSSSLTDSNNVQNVGHITHEAILQDASQLTSFTCGKNHDHGTNYHTASFQVSDDDHGSQDLLQYQDGAHVIIHAANNGFEDVIHAERKQLDESDEESSLASKEPGPEIITGNAKGASNHRYPESVHNDENTGTTDQIEEPSSHSYYREGTKFPPTENSPIQFGHTQLADSSSEKPKIIRELEDLSARFQLEQDKSKASFGNGKGVSYETFFTDESGGDIFKDSSRGTLIPNGFTVINVNDFEISPKDSKFRYEEYKHKGDVITEYPYYTIHHESSPDSESHFHSLPVIISEHHPSKEEKTKNHLPPQRNQPGKQYEVHENSGEKHKPAAEIFPPQKFPRQFHNPTPNLAGVRPQKNDPNSAKYKYLVSPPHGTLPLRPPIKKYKKYKNVGGAGKIKYRRPISVRRPVTESVRITSAPVLRVSVSA